MEQPTLHDLGGDYNQAALQQRMGTPLAAFYCPTRRSVMAYLNANAGTATKWVNVNPQPPMCGRSDYAGNSGDALDANGWSAACSVSTLVDGDNQSESTWAGVIGGAKRCTGVFYVRSTTKMADIKDGTANTYLVGEKYCDPDHYSDGQSPSDDQGWDSGWDWDTVRWVSIGPPFDLAHYQAYRPWQDTPGDETHGVAFGSARHQLQHGLLRRLGPSDRLLDRPRDSPPPGQRRRRAGDRRQDVLGSP